MKPNILLGIFVVIGLSTTSGRGQEFTLTTTKANITSHRASIANVGGEPLGRSSAYNVVVSAGGGNAGANQNAAPANGAAAGETCACTSLPPDGDAGGDLGGSYPAPTVRKLSGRPPSNAAPDTGQVLKWDGTGWAPAADNVGAAAGNGPTYTGGLGIELEGNSFNALSTTAMWNASQLAGRDILTTAPTVGQVLKWGGGAWLPGDDNVGGGAAAPALQTYFKNTFEHSPSLGMNGVYIFAQHSHTVTVTKKSRLIISGNFTLLSDGCLGCGVTKMGLDLMVNNAYKATLSSAEIANNSKVAVSVSNYMFDVEPGTYKIQFRATHPWIDGNVAGTADALYSSIIVLPQ